jgi:hypothetical protein
LLTFFLVIPISDARAGGCSAKPRPGDALNCEKDGPNPECITQCVAYRSCLNNNGNCAALKAQFEDCVRLNPPATPPRAGMTPGLGAVSKPGKLAVRDGRCVLTRAPSESSPVYPFESALFSAGSGSSSNISEKECPAMAETGSLAVTETLRSAVAALAGVPRSSIVDRTDLYDDLGLQYDDISRIARGLGAQLNIVIDESVVNRVRTLQDMADCQFEANQL